MPGNKCLANCNNKDKEGECTYNQDAHDANGVCLCFESNDPPLEFYGIARSMPGESLLIDLGDEGGLAQISVKNRTDRWKYYTKPLKITIEEVSEQDVINWMKTNNKENNDG